LYFHKYQRVYESETSTLLDLFLPEDGVLFDIGSNWGYFSLFAAVRKTFCGNVHSFEPWPPTFADLQSIVDQSGYADVITCHNLALSSKSGECGMKVHSHSGLNELDTRGECPVVKIAALDDILAVEGVDGVFIGPADLAADMGFPGNSAEAEVAEAIRDALGRIAASDKAAGILAVDDATAQQYAGWGAQFLAVGIDVVMLAKAARDTVKLWSGRG